MAWQPGLFVDSATPVGYQLFAQLTETRSDTLGINQLPPFSLRIESSRYRHFFLAVNWIAIIDRLTTFKIIFRLSKSHNCSHVARHGFVERAAAQRGEFGGGAAVLQILILAQQQSFVIHPPRDRAQISHIQPFHPQPRRRYTHLNIIAATLLNVYTIQTVLMYLLSHRLSAVSATTPPSLNLHPR